MMENATRLSLLERLGQTTLGRSWEDFAKIYDDMILRWLRSQGVNPEDADDIRQDVMTTVYKEIPNFRHNQRPGAFRCWLRRITANRLSRFWQKRQRRAKHEGGAALGEMAEQLADDRIVLEEQPAQQVAEEVGMTLGAVRVAQHLILQALKVVGQGLID